MIADVDITNYFEVIHINTFEVQQQNVILLPQLHPIWPERDTEEEDSERNKGEVMEITRERETRKHLESETR